MTTIRPFVLSDLNPLLQIENLSFPKSPYDRATFLDLYDLYRETFWVITETKNIPNEEEMLGYIVFTQDGHIISIAVHPLHRRKGIGTKLLQKAMEAPYVRGVWAEVRRSNRGAQAFYTKMGFQIIGKVPNYYGNEDALIVHWKPTLKSAEDD